MSSNGWTLLTRLVLSSRFVLWYCGCCTVQIKAVLVYKVVRSRLLHLLNLGVRRASGDI